MNPGRVPEFFIVGHGKSGTTAMYEMLVRQPGVFMPACKEPWFFATELRERMPPRPEGTPATLAEYEALFAPARRDQVAGESTTLYLWSRTAAARIAEVRPDAKIIVFLREPASFLRSLHLQFLQTYIETEPGFRAAIEAEPRRRAGEEPSRYSYWPQLLLYSEHVRYTEQLCRFEQHFPSEQMLVLIYDDFLADNAGTVARVLDFLGVEQRAPVEQVQANPTVIPRSRRLHELTQAVGVGRGPASRAVKAAIKAVTPGGLRRRAFYSFQNRLVFGRPPAADEEFLLELRRRYRGEVEQAGEHLGRDLVTLWGYEQLG